jgi:hypothetical protein
MPKNKGLSDVGGGIEWPCVGCFSVVDVRYLYTKPFHCQHFGGQGGFERIWMATKKIGPSSISSVPGLPYFASIVFPQEKELIPSATFHSLFFRDPDPRC